MHPIGDLLTSKDVLSLTRTDTVMQACRAMDERGVGAVLIHSEEREAEGIFTERDLMVRVIVEGLDPNTTLLGDVMTVKLYTVDPADRACEVQEEMRKRHIRHVPVMQDGKVCGVLSLRDLLRADLAEKIQEVEAITSYIQGGLPTDDAS
jgi:signal-transduction protein with cAMP-binding, CBS, and nucleotidyltransferase domain